MDASTALVASMDTRADELDRQPVGLWHRKVLALVSLGAFLGVYEMFLGSALGAGVTAKWTLGTTERHLIVAAAFIGMALGALTLGVLADLCGRRRIFLLNSAALAIFSVAAASAQNPTALVIFQILAGIAAGSQLPLAATYVGEIAPRRARGRMVCLLYLLAFCAGLVAGYLGGQYAAGRHWILDGWRWMLLLAATIAFLQWRLRRSLPESPRWELERTGPGVDHLFDEPRRPPWQAVFSWRNRNRTAMLIVANLLCAAVYGGFTAIGPLVLMSKGFPVVASPGFIGLSVLGLPVGAALAATLIDRYERKNLIVGFALCIALFGAVFSTAANTGLIRGAGFLLAVAGGAFACSLHTYQIEVFPTALRVTGASVGYAFFLGGLAVLPFLAHPVLDTLGSVPVFIGSAALVAVLCITVSLIGPPSTGRSLDRI